MKRINNIRFYNLRKLAEAEKRAGDNFDEVVKMYEMFGGKFDVVEEKVEAPKKPAKKVAPKKNAKKVSKK